MTNRSSQTLWILVTALVLMNCRSAAAAAPEMVKAELLADTTHVVPGQNFTVGLLLRIEPEWHVYWTNPGDSGAPTSVKFTAPDGYTVGPVQYPVPVRFTQPGDAVGFGYEDSLLLTAKVTAPADLGSAKEVKFGASANWLVCQEVCIPGRAKLSLTLPVAAKGEPAHANVFGPWAERLPVDPSGAADIASTQWSRHGDEDALAIDWKNGAAAKDVDLFPGRSDAVDVGRPQVKTDGAATTLTLKVRVLQGEKPEAHTLPALLVYTDKDGKRRGVNVAIPLTAGK